MKILFHGWGCPPHGGGVGTYMLAMAHALTVAGHDVVIVTGRHPDRPFEDHEGSVRILREYDRCEAGSPRVVRRVLDLARAFDADIIEGADHLGECVRLLRSRNRPPVLIKAHGALPLSALRRAQAFYPWQRLTVGIACLRAWRQVRAERICLERADAVLAPAQQMLNWLRQDHIRLPAHTGVVPNPVKDASTPTPGKEAVEPTLLMAGRISYLKGIEFLSPLLEQVLVRFPTVRLEIAGSDTYARWTGSMAAWLTRDLAGLSERVHFLGTLNRQEMDAAYRRAWVVILPSRFDNFPNVVLEAMVRQRPVVASATGGVPEILSGTRNRVADPRHPAFAEAVMDFLADRNLRVKAGQEGRQKAIVEYAPLTVARQYVEFVQSCDF